MARVIYTGPLNPVIFARAKKEAEKAERIKGYTPRVIKTPSHTVVYSKTGPEVKAVVMDMLAPITFSIPGSAIPVAPNFLHLHPDLPEKVYGRPDYATASGVVKYWGINSDYIGENYAGVLFPKNESSYFIDNTVRLATGNETQYIALDEFWDSSQGVMPSGSVTFASQNNTPIDNIGKISTVATFDSGFSETEFNGFLRDTLIFHSEINAGQKIEGSINYSSTASAAFLNENIRDHLFSGSDGVGVASIPTSNISTSFDYRVNFDTSDKTQFYAYRESSVNSFDINYLNSIVLSSGGYAYPFVKVDDHNETRYTKNNFSYATSLSIQSKTKITHGVSVNLSMSELASRTIVDSDKTYENDEITTSAEYIESFKQSISESGTEFDKHVFVAGSVEVGDFLGLLIWAKVYDSYPDIQKTQYQAESVFVQSHLAYYFDFFNSQYDAVDAPFWDPPDTTSDGICLPHAWFFVRENETRQTDFYPNNHNRLSIVIYPQGRHEFSVDEAEIITVDLDHTPRFVARPGGAIAVSMLATNGGSASVPFTVSGLSQEFDDEGNPTGFYLADDGVLSGSFTGSGVPVVFKLSPRQSLPTYRTVTVVAETEREHGVSACFEVLGGGVRVQPGQPVITLERISESVLSGQASAFCLTATHMAHGSQLKYEVRRGEDVVDTGFVTIVNGAGIVEYTAPFRSLSAGGSPVKYVLADRLAPSATPSTVEYEFAIIHDQAPEPKRFSVRFAHEQYSSASDRPAALPLPPMFYMTPTVSANGEDGFFQSNAQITLVQRVWYSLKSKRVYVLFWDGRSCEVSNVLKQNPESGQYEFNPDWKEVAFDYPPAADPYNIKGTLEPYVYAYMDYENNLNNGA